MFREKFFTRNYNELTIEKILELTNSTIDRTDIDIKSIKISDIATLEKANKDDLSFLSSQGKYKEIFEKSNAGAYLVSKNLNYEKNDKILIKCEDPYYAYSIIASYLYSEKAKHNGTNNNYKIGKNTIIAPGAYIGNGVEIGDNCYIGPNSTIYDDCIIGDNCIINAGAVISFCIMQDSCIIHNGVKIGQDGFGYAISGYKINKIIQIGIVEIGSNVEIGANTCIDRGAIDNTTIGNDVKIDNLVQIGHNVIVGDATFIAGCAAIAGSTRIGKFVQIGGNSSINGHITIGDGVKISGMSGILRSIKSNQIVAGIPAIPIREWRKITAKFINKKED